MEMVKHDNACVSRSLGGCDHPHPSLHFGGGGSPKQGLLIDGKLNEECLARCVPECWNAGWSEGEMG